MMWRGFVGKQFMSPSHKSTIGIYGMRVLGRAPFNQEDSYPADRLLKEKKNE